MNAEDIVIISKFMSLILRHKPEVISATIDSHGWLTVDALLPAINEHLELEFPFEFEHLQEVVENNNKQRFSFSTDLQKIRANQGHSIAVDLELLPEHPPKVLYHGTAIQNIESIREKGLLRGERNHVHLSFNYETAISVGIRYGKPIVLKIDTKSMYNDGIKFYFSKNGVWLTDYVAPEYIKFKEEYK